MNFKKAIDYCENVFDGTHETPKYVDVGYKFLTSKNIMDGYLDKENAFLISQEDYDSFNIRSQVHKWDVLFSMIGSVGNVCLIQDDNIDFAVKNMGVFSCRNEYKAKWLYYYFKSPYAKKLITNQLHGAVQKFLGLEKLREFPILEYSDDKKPIVDLLSNIDEKIALNNKTNTELENMAETIYDYWFTQFDFPDKNGHPYKTSGGQMVYNETLKRDIPVGWEVKNILDCCKVIDCLHSKKPDYCYEDENCYLLQLENLIDLKLIDLTNKYYVSKKDYETWTSKTKVKQGDLVVTNAGRVGGVSRIPNYIETGIGRNMTSIRPISISEYLLCYFFSSSDCDKQIRQNTDQGAFFQSLNVKGIKKLNLTIPPKEIQEKFDSLVGKIRLQIESNHKENEELTKLRDYLLPLLMNGQIKVK